MKHKTDIYGNPIFPQPKCKHCGKLRWHHKAVTLECPLGLKHRVMGYTSFGATKFEAKK